MATIILDPGAAKQLAKLSRDGTTKAVLQRMLNLIEQDPAHGKLLDGKNMYEMKTNHPPLRVYYRWRKEIDTARILWAEHKRSAEQQQRTIDRLRSRDPFL